MPTPRKVGRRNSRYGQPLPMTAHPEPWPDGHRGSGHTPIQQEEEPKKCAESSCPCSAFLPLAAALVSAAPAAFAMRVTPPGGASPLYVAPAVHHAAGLAPWQIALIAIASLVIVAAALLCARRVRTSRRPASSPATTYMGVGS